MTGKKALNKLNRTTLLSMVVKTEIETGWTVHSIEWLLYARQWTVSRIDTCTHTSRRFMECTNTNWTIQTNDAVSLLSTQQQEELL